MPPSPLRLDTRGLFHSPASNHPPWPSRAGLPDAVPRAALVDAKSAAALAAGASAAAAAYSASAGPAGPASREEGESGRGQVRGGLCF
jgi:hypothetical protein